MNPFFSIIIPFYNVEKYLLECLNSIKCQNFTNYEVICINDSSTDNSLEILKSYSLDDCRFMFFSQNNSGPGVARNLGIEKAKGDYITFLDADDLLTPNILENIYILTKEIQPKVISCDYTKLYEENNCHKYCNNSKDITKLYTTKLKKCWYFKPNQIKKDWFITISSACAKYYERNFIQKIHAKFSETYFAEDQLFSRIVYLNSPKIYYYNTVGYVYRMRVGSTVNSKTNKCFGIFRTIELVRIYLENNNLYEEYKEIFKLYMIRQLSVHYKYLPNSNINSYVEECHKLLNDKEFDKFITSINHVNYIEKILSLKNEIIDAKKFKVLTILGFKIKWAHKKK